MTVILFTPFTANLAETTRAIAIAQAIAGEFDCRFASYGGQFETLIDQAGFPHTRLEPRVTPELMEHAYAVERGKKLDAFMPLERVRQMVAGEIEFLHQLRPATVVTGMTISFSLSCAAKNTPLIWVIQSGMRVLATARSGAFNDLDMLAPLQWLPKKGAHRAEHISTHQPDESGHAIIQPGGFGPASSVKPVEPGDGTILFLMLQIPPGKTLLFAENTNGSNIQPLIITN